MLTEANDAIGVLSRIILIRTVPNISGEVQSALSQCFLPEKLDDFRVKQEKNLG